LAQGLPGSLIFSLRPRPAMSSASAAMCFRLGRSLGRSLRPQWPAGSQLHGPSAVGVAGRARRILDGWGDAAGASRACGSVPGSGQVPSSSAPSLVRISYMSEMKGERGDDPDDIIRDVAAKAAAHNTRERITGFLSYDATLHTVWQVLEGEPDTLMPLWVRIQKDERHTVDEASVSIEKAERRVFPFGWGLKVRVRSATEI